MTLSKSDADLFYKLVLQLHLYANRETGALPDCRTIDDLRNLEPAEKGRIRDALFAKPELIDRFVQENPSGFDGEELAIVSKWRNFIAGDFFIERYLAKHAIFIKDTTVYGVVALYGHFDDFVPKESLPAYVKAVLLPFKGKLIYDGLMSFYPVHFGSGIRGSLREKYLRAKQRGQIIETLDAVPEAAAKKSPKPARDWRPEIDALFDQAQRLKGDKSAPAVQGEIFKLVKAVVDLAKSSVHAPNDLEDLWEKARKAHLKLENVRKALDREE